MKFAEKDNPSRRHSNQQPVHCVPKSVPIEARWDVWNKPILASHTAEFLQR